jgi:hypothetical protein
MKLSGKFLIFLTVCILFSHQIQSPPTPVTIVTTSPINQPKTTSTSTPTTTTTSTTPSTSTSTPTTTPTTTTVTSSAPTPAKPVTPTATPATPAVTTPPATPTTPPASTTTLAATTSTSTTPATTPTPETPATSTPSSTTTTPAATTTPETPSVPQPDPKVSKILISIYIQNNAEYSAKLNKLELILADKKDPVMKDNLNIPIKASTIYSKGTVTAFDITTESTSLDNFSGIKSITINSDQITFANVKTGSTLSRPIKINKVNEKWVLDN